MTPIMLHMIQLLNIEKKVLLKPEFSCSISTLETGLVLSYRESIHKTGIILL